MRFLVLLLLAIPLLVTPEDGHAAEGSTAAGVAGGSDMRSAFLPPPGLYAGLVGARSESEDFYDGKGRRVPALDDLGFKGRQGAFAFLYVPELDVVGGRIGLLGSFSYARECGQLTGFSPYRCQNGWGDPYLEVNWSRFFGTLRSSRHPHAFAIAEGLAIQVGLGVVFPIGQYDAKRATTEGLSIGNNVWDVAPMVAVTYTSPPLIGEGTEFSAKIYWNNYRTNKDTHYRTGDIVTIDFAITERIGPVQFGLAGLYARQIEDDSKFGIKIIPDGRRTEVLSLGPVFALDLPELGGSLKIKALGSVSERNSVTSKGIVLTYGTKLW